VYQSTATVRLIVNALVTAWLVAQEWSSSAPRHLCSEVCLQWPSERGRVDVAHVGAPCMC
jgi:hypothetical protein